VELVLTAASAELVVHALFVDATLSWRMPHALAIGGLLSALPKFR
jgi:hypothetical protein